MRSAKSATRLLAAILILSILWVATPGQVFGATPQSYAWGYYEPTTPGSILGSQGIQVLGTPTSGYDYLAGNVGICKNYEPVCNASFIETGIAYGDLTSDHWKQYVRFSDSSGTDTLWWDSAQLNQSYYYKLRIEYIGGNVDAWVVSRAICNPSCGSLSEIRRVDSGDVGFTAGDSVYAGASGENGSNGELPISTEIDSLQYKNGSNTWGDWDWWPSNYVRSDSCHTLNHPSSYMINVSSSC